MKEIDMFEWFVKIFIVAMSSVAVVAVPFLLYLVFVLAPIVFYAQAECLRAGYPRAHVTIGAERYCSTLDGSVTVKVTKQ